MNGAAIPKKKPEIPIPTMAKVAPTGIDLFAGAGGLTLGARLAGINIIAAVDSDSKSIETHTANHPESAHINTDIRKITERNFETNHVDFLFGGPPCQGYSTSNQRTRTLLNEKNWLFKEFFRIAAFLQPRWLVIENVPGILDAADGQFAMEISAEIEKLDYQATTWRLDASDFGVPQRRARIFFLGSREGITPLPPRTHDLKISVRDAILDLPILKAGAYTNVRPYRCDAKTDYAKSLRGNLQECSGHLVSRNNDVVLERYRHIKEGQNWAAIPPRLMQNYNLKRGRRSLHTGIYRRLKYDLPSVVITNYRKSMLVHPTQNRGLSVREAARLQSFPDSYVFHGSIGFQQQQVGNAVPPLFAKQIFETLFNYL